MRREITARHAIYAERSQSKRAKHTHTLERRRRLTGPALRVVACGTRTLPSPRPRRSSDQARACGGAHSAIQNAPLWRSTRGYRDDLDRIVKKPPPKHKSTKPTVLRLHECVLNGPFRLAQTRALFCCAPPPPPVVRGRRKRVLPRVVCFASRRSVGTLGGCMGLLQDSKG